jgi:hypothetical protein
VHVYHAHPPPLPCATCFSGACVDGFQPDPQLRSVDRLCPEAELQRQINGSHRSPDFSVCEAYSRSAWGNLELPRLLKPSADFLQAQVACSAAAAIGCSKNRKLLTTIHGTTEQENAIRESRAKAYIVLNNCISVKSDFNRSHAAQSLCLFSNTIVVRSALFAHISSLHFVLISLLVHLNS